MWKKIKILFVFVFLTFHCVPKPSPSLLGIFVLPLVTQTSETFTIESTSPTNGATGVSVTPTITIVMTQAIETTSLNTNITCSPSCPSLTGGSSNRTITLTPTSALTSGVTYTITLNQNIQSIFGLTLGTNTSFSFTTL
ncbi:Ig-like protein [Leptospira yanagawae serovar Saopaulo str. Sao Paulo = ATCC 700523]|nr:Ig-like domain-containing protein [Leptospira yanagawae]EOQ89410.1 Ig-like protein [Leptospira yanagawae serovar Saopaulo str. Sao Paulo = ATCC 700523]